MTTEVRMPQLGESVTEGTVVHWLKQPGDTVALDDPLAEIETEKVNVEIPSPYEGQLTQQLVAEGQTVAVGVPIATIEERVTAGAPPKAAVPAAPQTSANAPAAMRPVAASANGSGRRAAAPAFTVTGTLGPADKAYGMFSAGEEPVDESTEGMAAQDEAPTSAAASSPETVANGTGAAAVNGSAATNDAEMSGRFSPAVLRLAREHGVDLARLPGTGAGGRISRKDVQQYIDAGQPGAQAPAAVPQPSIAAEAPPATAAAVPQPAPAINAAPAVEAMPAAAPGPRLAAEPGSDEELEPMTPTRRAIATHMVQSVRTSPHAWMAIETDVTRLVQFRGRVRDEFRAREGVELTYLPFMVKAVVGALKQYPRLNSSWSEDGVVLKRRINIGIAVNTAQGLVVPVVHDADNLSLAGLAKAIHELVERARGRRLRLEDVQGGTFTIDNVGPFGSVVSQPIINQPQCAIVTMESIIKRPVVIDDAIAVRSMMNCCISFDHRIVDGGDVGPFMLALKQSLEAMGSDTPLY